MNVKFSLLFSLAFLLSISFALAFSTDGLASHYSLENNGYDNARNLTSPIYGSYGFSQGQYGQAISFVATVNSYLDAGEGDNMTENITQFSVSGWVYKRSNDVSRAGPIRQAGVFGISNNANKKWEFIVINNSGRTFTASSNAILTYANWTHLVGVYNGTHLLMYVNGILQNSQPAFYGKTATHTNNVEIGRDYPYSGVINGSIDEVMIYTRALNSTEVQEIYEDQTLPPLCFDDPTCAGQGGFCDVSNPYTCTLSQDGCLVREDLPSCNANELCEDGSCVPDPCYGVSMCGNYSDSISCNFNSCNVNAFCSWNSQESLCEEYIPVNNFSVPTTGLVAYYGFDGDASNEIGNIPGTLVGSSQFSTGQVGQAIEFNGVYGSYADMGEGENVSEDLNTFSVSSWIYKKSADTGRSGPIRQLNVFGVSTSSTKVLQFSVRNISGQSATASANSSMALNVWNHVVGVYNGTNLLLYVNGILQNSKPAFYGKTATHTNNIEIGRDYAYSTTLNGSVDDTLIYTRALTLEEIQQIYTSQLNNTPLCQSGESYFAGKCLFDGCAIVNICGDYTTQSSCDTNLCQLNGLCSWDAQNNSCIPQTCNDGVMNQDEVAIDCGGTCFTGTQEIMCGNSIDDNRNCVPDEAEPMCAVTNSSWSFVLMSDSYGGLGGSVFRGYEWALQTNADLKFMVAAGDFEKEFTFDNLFQSVLKPAYFSNYTYTPWFTAPGNHNADNTTVMDFTSYVLGARLSTQLQDLGTLESFKNGVYNDSSVYGRRNTTYSFDYRNAHFIILNQYFDTYDALDGHPLACINPTLYNWLAEDLANNTQPFIFVLGHEPAWPNGVRHCGDSLDDFRCFDNYVDWSDPSRPSRDQFWDLLKQYNVTAHLVGHEHAFSARVVNNLSDFPGIHLNVTSGGYYCDTPYWNCYCDAQAGLPNLQNNAVVSPGNGVLEYNNGITRDGGHFHVIRVHEDKVEFNAYNDTGVVEYNLEKKITYQI